MYDYVKKTAQVSLGIQLFATLSLVVSFALPAAEGVRSILAVESVSQLVEFVYYAVAVLAYGGVLETWTRYLDWYISTPVMLLSTSMFFFHRSGRDPWTALEGPHLYLSWTWNSVMLGFGLAIELDVMPRFLGLFLGSAAFVASWTFLARDLPDDALSTGLFFAIFAVWALYGVAAAFPFAPRNVAYNLLDLVSKNFYGLFLLVYALS